MSDCYNVRIRTYPNSNRQQYTFYARSVKRGYSTDEKDELSETERKQMEHFTKTHKNSNRTLEQQQQCIKQSLKNTKNLIYNYARANTWEWFITLTFDRTKTDASDYDIIIRRLSIFMNDLQKRKAPNMKYLIVPELHADGKHYHFHGLLSNVDELHFAFSGHFDKSDNPIFNIKEWSWGFTTATRVKNTESVSKYITKYITKESIAYLKEKNRFYHSRNLDKPVEVYTLMYENDFLNDSATRITYAKTITVPKAHQQLHIYETSPHAHVKYVHKGRVITFFYDSPYATFTEYMDSLRRAFNPNGRLSERSENVIIENSCRICNIAI